jgi:nicotinamidase-related amidase
MTTALLIVDVQQHLTFGAEAAPDAAALIARINGLARAARAHGRPVVLIQHEEAGSPLAHGSAGWELADGLDAQEGDLRVRKTQPSAFEGTPLHGLLQARGVQRVVVCGLQTDCCVNATARAALPLGYTVVLAADAHSTEDRERAAADVVAEHNAALAALGDEGETIQVVPAVAIEFGAG